jgi:uncharacterized protein YecE (DUF72 family)
MVSLREEMATLNGRTNQIHVGVSGWDYASWQGGFYPTDVSRDGRLQFLAAQLDTVELNSSFYSLQRPTSYQRWYDETPPGFQFAVKGGRFITHLKRLNDVEQGLANFFASGVLALREKLGPVLWQLPASLTLDVPRIEAFLGLLPHTTLEAAALATHCDDKLREPAYLTVDVDRPVLHALEVRDRSYDTDQFFQQLKAHGVACVVSDSPTWPLVDHRTADHTYVRLHGHTQLYASGYSSRSLDTWARRCELWAHGGPVFVYFDNDSRGHAPFDALGLIRRLSVNSGG